MKLTYATMVFVCIFGALSRHKTNLWRNFMSLGHSLSNRGLCALRKRFRMNVLSNQTRHVPIIPGYMLLTHLMLVATDPGSCVATAVTKHILVRLILVSHVLEGSLVVQGHWGGLVGTVRDWGLGRVEEINDLSIHVTRSHTELVYFGGDVPGITWHILLVKAHFAVAGAQ